MSWCGVLLKVDTLKGKLVHTNDHSCIQWSLGEEYLQVFAWVEFKWQYRGVDGSRVSEVAGHCLRFVRVATDRGPGKHTMG